MTLSIKVIILQIVVQQRPQFGSKQRKQYNHTIEVNLVVLKISKTRPELQV